MPAAVTSSYTQFGESLRLARTHRPTCQAAVNQLQQTCNAGQSRARKAYNNSRMETTRQQLDGFDPQKASFPGYSFLSQNR